MSSNKLIFLYSQSPRSGHNFVAEVIRCLINSTTPIGDRSEIPFAPIIASFNKVKQAYYMSQGVNEFLDTNFINNVRDNLLSSKKNNVFLKYTSFDGAEYTKKSFPKDLHIISFRDPKDCLVSLFKGMKFKNDFKSKVKKILLPFGFYHYTCSRKYNKKISKSLPNTNGFFILKHEDLFFRNRKVLEGMIEVFNSNITYEDFIKKIDGIGIINTSFYREETKSNSLWEVSRVTKEFIPVNRENGFNKLQILGIKLGSATLRKKLGYI